MLEPLIQYSRRPEACNFIKTVSPTQVFFRKIFKTTSERLLQYPNNVKYFVFQCSINQKKLF